MADPCVSADICLTSILQVLNLNDINDLARNEHFKKVFYTHLLPELKARGKAVLVITHDDHYFDVADRIIKLDYGKLADAPSDIAESSILIDTPQGLSPMSHR